MEKVVILISIISSIIISIISFVLGKKTEQTKQLKDCKDLQDKINKKEKIKTIEELKDKLKKSSFILLFILFGCKNISCNVYIPLEEYTTAEQEQIIDILGKYKIIDKFILDYYNLRETIRLINK